MRLTVLSVAYPFARVAPDTAGGAEQVLRLLDQKLCEAGHRSLVVAPAGSILSGRLFSPDPVSGSIDAEARETGWRRQLQAISAVLENVPVTVLHMHGLDYACYLPPPGVPVLVTLHLPLSCYAREALHPSRPDTWLHCVSAAQHAAAPRHARMLAPIENGVDLAAFAGRHARRGFALMLARICPEKGVHLALDAARAAGVPLLIAGEVFPYAEHRRYFDDEVRPRLDRLRRWIGPVGPARKRRLLAAARCVLIPSLAEETSSLVAREAAAAGTPVIAFARGALAETVAHGRTGFLVEDAAGMAAAIGRAGEIEPEACRAMARARFSAEVMVAAYFRLYAKLGGAARCAAS